MKSLHSILIILLLSIPALAQKKKTAEAVAPATQNAIDGKITGLKKYTGFFDYYYDEKKDKLFLLIDKFDTEFLYITALSAGIGSNDIGLDRGQLSGEKVVKFDRRGPKVLMLEPNQRYRAITKNKDELKAVEEAFAQSVIWGFPVEAETDNKVLVDATGFFLRDAHDVIGRLRMSKQGSYQVEASRSALFVPGLKDFPKNAEFEATLTFTGQPEGQYIRSVTPTPNSITVREHHSFVELPDNNYKLRKYDPRSGFFGIAYYDFAAPITEPIEKRFIARHRLEKKDPTAAISEAVEPIIYYVDRGTPEPTRTALIEGGRWWNQAFEAAGYKNAFQVELMPEGADPLDVRYNVIQWIHRSTRGWSYGATVTDPRTGEIIKGLVSLGSLRDRQDFLIAEGLLAPYEGKTVPPEMEQMAIARLKQLSAHEIGHTLGIAHAYSSSAEHDASVMDYPHPNVEIVNGKLSLEHAYDDKIGAWDKVSIQYGYSDFPKGTNEEEALNAIIQKSLKDGLTFLSDQDARPAGGAHPFAHLWDNGVNASDQLQRVMEIRSIALKNFGEKNIRPGAPMATLEEVLVPMYFFHRYQLEASAKILGGLNYRYALRGDGQFATEFVSPAEQMKALDRLIETVSPSALMIPESILKLIPPRPMDYERHRELIESRTDLTFDALGAAETAAQLTFGLILHPARAGRLVEHHARDAKQPSLESVMDKLIGASFKSPAKSGYEGALQITANEVLLFNLMALAKNKDASTLVRSITALKLEQLKVWLTPKVAVTDEDWKAHYAYALAQIQQFKDDSGSKEPTNELAAPPGMPIGMLDDGFCSQN